MKKETIKILVNGEVYEEINKIDHVFGSLFMINWDLYSFMDVPAIKKHMMIIIELVKELAPKLPAAVNRTIKAMKGMIDTVEDKTTFLKFITNVILAREGLGALPGFGCATKKQNIISKLNINPEKSPMFVK